jgi:mRNA deadenylase 3'-5' endonuclease subunit Ccr4
VPFSVATWNILATSYIRREFYPKTPRQALDPAWRVPALASRAAALDVDILCLQEVEVPAFITLQESLGAAGYEGKYAGKGHNRPDGGAVFFRRANFALIDEKRIAYADGNGGLDSGNIAQLLTLGSGERRLAVLNTHLKWDPPHTEPERQLAYRQIHLALDALAQASPLDARILCGDFNVTPESDVVQAVLAAGMDYAHRDCWGIATCNSNRKAKLIDYLFFSGPLRANPVMPEAIADETVLPSLEQPSDHLPLVAGFEWTT